MASNITEFESFETLVEKLRQEIRCRCHELVWIIQTRESELLKELESIAIPQKDRKRQEGKLKELRDLYDLNERNFRSNELQAVQQNILEGLSNEINKLKKELTLPYGFSYNPDIVQNLRDFGELKTIVAKQPIPPVPSYKPPLPSSTIVPKPAVSVYSTITHPIYGVCNKGNGSEDLDRAWGIDIHYPTGNIFIADQCNHRIQVFNGDGVHLLTYLVSSGRGQMKWPICLAIHNDKLFVSQHGNDCVTVFGMKGSFVNQFGKSGKKNGEFKSPRGITMEEMSGDIFVCDYGNNRVQVFTGDYKFKSKFGIFIHPMCIQLSGTCIIVLDEGNPCLHIYNLNQTLKRSIISNGLFGQVRSPRTFCLDSIGNILMTDNDCNCICIFNPAGVLVHQITKGVLRPVGVTLDTRGRIVLVSHRDDDCLQFF
ncbi:PEP-CTERM domain protein [Oopsacas minuta]|uniref:PEP-CTERM domain protein n=1 Tax=Oopsacas minuta TaxID=111878 RepID=A0AAV7JLQ7_9METZ|nr:PEP-CTERM domain protein [Oopsacas minuta]